MAETRESPSRHLEHARKAEEIMDLFPPFKARTFGTARCEQTFHRWSQLSESQQQWVLELLEANMKHLYNSCVDPDWKWDRAKKMEELSDKQARFLICSEVGSDGGNSIPVAFVHFQFLNDEDTNDEDTLYVFEIQVEKKYQHKGIGKFLMKLSELIAIKFHMPQVMLTVLSGNDGAMKFYRQLLKYEIDDNDPLKCDPETAMIEGDIWGYRILSKRFGKRPSAAATSSKKNNKKKS